MEGIGSLFYVDDVVATFPPKQAVSNAVGVALPMYERMVRARYNLGPQKTAVMCCYGADPPDIQNMQCSVYKALGCFIDEHLILDNQGAFVLNVGKPCSRNFPTCPTSVVFLPCRCSGSGCRTKG